MNEKWKRPLMKGLTAKQDNLFELAYAAHINGCHGIRPSPVRESEALVKKGVAQIVTHTITPDRFGSVDIHYLQPTARGIELYEDCFVNCPKDWTP